MIEQLEEELSKAQEPKTITVIRGRLISKIKEELKRNDITEEEKNILTEKINKYIYDQKKHLNERYIKEFIKDKAILGSVFTTLPRGMEISIKKIATTIEELKQAKTNKSKLFGLIDVLKSIGQTAITPFLYAGKFAIRHWYAVLISLGLLDLTDTKIFKGITKFFGKDENNSALLGIIDKVKKDPIVDATRTGVHKVTDKAVDMIKDKISDSPLGEIGDKIDSAASLLDGMNNITSATEKIQSFAK